MAKDKPEGVKPTVVLRPVAEDDEAFLRDVYATTRADELGQAGLAEAQEKAFIHMQFSAQSEDYRRRFPQADHDVVLYKSEPVGRLYVARSPEEIRILDLTILPTHRNAGIGTSLVRDLLAEARTTNRPVRIYVDNTSPSTRLFERLGFAKMEQQSLSSLLEWRPGERPPDVNRARGRCRPTR